MRQVAGAAGVMIAAVVLAGCTGGSSGDPAASTTSSAPTTATSAPTPTGSSTPAPSSPTAVASAASSAAGPSSSAPAAGASIAAPPDPVVEAGNAGAWTLTRAAPGAPDERQVPSLQCGQDGSVTADGLRLSFGAASLTLTDPAVTVTGTADVDAAGGTFHGRDADTAVAFTWIC